MGTFGDPVAVFAALLVFMVAVQLTWMVRHEDVLRDSVKVAENAANAARQSAESAKTVERAHIFAFPTAFERLRDAVYAQDIVRITMHASNYGRTPGTLTRLEWNIRPFTGEPWVMPEDFPQMLAIRKIIRPSRDPIPFPLYVSNLAETEGLEFYGRAYFEDIFGDEWSGAWAYRVEPSENWVLYPLAHHARVRAEGDRASEINKPGTDHVF